MTNQTNVPEDVNEYDDLTRFADENFDTGEVDLFQFIGDDSSPLTRLKSVILSLDWDITDEYLQELAEELAELAPAWQDDRAATIYLQGMGKIGKYLRLRGAHAHPNAIKLLLTYFYDFEKIFSTPDLDDAQITRMLQNDVRKFKVLQYQIKLAEESADEEVRGLNGGRETGRAGNALRQFKAAILELDWEVTDDSLARFAEALKVLGDAQIENKAALLLIHGMQVLGRYISDERAHAHPDVFNLLHAFHGGLERILDTGPGALNRQQKKNILLDRINRLNHLKSLIAPQNDKAAATGSAPAGEGAELKNEPVSVEALPEFENLIEPAGMPQTAAREALPLQTTPSSGQRVYTGEFELADEREAVASIDGLPSFEGQELGADSPAVAADMRPLQTTTAAEPLHEAEDSDHDFELFADSDADHVPDATPDEDAALFAGETALAEEFSDNGGLDNATDPADMVQDIDDVFGNDPKRAMLSAEEEYPIEELPASAFEAVDDKVSDGFRDHHLGSRDEIMPALTEVEEEAALTEEDSDLLDTETQAELNEKLDFFFGEAARKQYKATPALATAATVDKAFDDDDEAALFPPTSSDDELPAALADAEPPEDAVLFDREDSEIAAKLDGFFGDSDEKAAGSGSESAPLGADEADLFTGEASDATAALADVERPADAASFHAEDREFSAELDDFFGSSDEQAGTGQPLPGEEEALFADDADFFAGEPAAPAVLADDDALLADTPGQGVEAKATLPAALADVEAPEDAALFADEGRELSAELDDFFGSSDEQAPITAQESPADARSALRGDVSPHFEFSESEEKTLNAEERFADQGTAAPIEADGDREALLIPDDGGAIQPASCSIDDNIVAALSDVEVTGKTAGMLYDEAEPDFQNQLDNFFNLPSDETQQEFSPEPAAEPAVQESPGAGPREAALPPAPGTEPRLSLDDAPFALSEEESAESVQQEPAPAPSSFDDLVDSAEVHDFLLSGHDIEEIPDEELAFTEEEIFVDELPGTEEAGAAAETPADDLFAAPDMTEAAGDAPIDQPESVWIAEPAGPEPADSVLAMDELLSGEETQAILNEDAPEIPTAPSSVDALATLGASLPALLSQCSPRHLSEAKEQLQTLRSKVALSPMQMAAAGMLDTVLSGLSGQMGPCTPATASVMDRLYRSLAEPREHMSLETVTAFTQWVQGLLATARPAAEEEAPADETLSARELHRELSAFRSSMEQTLARIQDELRQR